MEREEKKMKENEEEEEEEEEGIEWLSESSHLSPIPTE
jgi:hypothetical protein